MGKVTVIAMVLETEEFRLVSCSRLQLKHQELILSRYFMTGQIPGEKTKNIKKN